MSDVDDSDGELSKPVHEPGTVVWGKLPSFPAWPARVMKRDWIDGDVDTQSGTCVQFFNDGEQIAFLEPHSMTLWEAGDEHIASKYQKQKTKSLREQLKVAMQMAAAYFKAFPNRTPGGFMEKGHLFDEVPVGFQETALTVDDDGSESRRAKDSAASSEDGNEDGEYGGHDKKHHPFGKKGPPLVPFSSAAGAEHDGKGGKGGKGGTKSGGAKQAAKHEEDQKLVDAGLLFLAQEGNEKLERMSRMELLGMLSLLRRQIGQLKGKQRAGKGGRADRIPARGADDGDVGAGSPSKVGEKRRSRSIGSGAGAVEARGRKASRRSLGCVAGAEAGRGGDGRLSEDAIRFQEMNPPVCGTEDYSPDKAVGLRNNVRSQKRAGLLPENEVMSPAAVRVPESSVPSYRSQSPAGGKQVSRGPVVSEAEGSDVDKSVPSPVSGSAPPAMSKTHPHVSTGADRAAARKGESTVGTSEGDVSLSENGSKARGGAGRRGRKRSRVRVADEEEEEEAEEGEKEAPPVSASSGGGTPTGHHSTSTRSPRTGDHSGDKALVGALDRLKKSVDLYFYAVQAVQLDESLETDPATSGRLNDEVDAVLAALEAVKHCKVDRDLLRVTGSGIRLKTIVLVLKGVNEMLARQAKLILLDWMTVFRARGGSEKAAAATLKARSSSPTADTSPPKEGSSPAGDAPKGVSDAVSLLQMRGVAVDKFRELLTTVTQGDGWPAPAAKPSAAFLGRLAGAIEGAIFARLTSRGAAADESGAAPASYSEELKSVGRVLSKASKLVNRQSGSPDAADGTDERLRLVLDAAVEKTRPEAFVEDCLARAAKAGSGQGTPMRRKRRGEA